MRKKFVLLSCVLLAAVLLSGCTGAAAWPGLSATSDVAYLANTTVVHAIDVKTHKELWSFAGEKSGGFLSFGASPTLLVINPVISPDGMLIVLDSGTSHVIYAVDPTTLDPDEKNPTPKIEWKFSDADGLWIAQPLIVDDRLFAPNSDGKVYVIDPANGKLIETITVAKSSEEEARLWGQPVSDGERIFITSLDKSVVAIDLDTHEVLWHEDIGGAVPGGPVLGSDGMLYVGSLAKQLEQFDPVTGEHAPVLDTNGWIWGTPIAHGDNLYFGDVEGYFYSYNISEGGLNFEPVQPDAVITASPLVVGDQILVATESGDVYSVSADGTLEAWYQLEGKGKAYTTPVLAGDLVLVAYLESDYYLVALDSEGDEKWTFAGN